MDVGFVTAAVGRIARVGVAPARGLMVTGGSAEAWVNVNVNNPGRRWGFVDRGRRGRFGEWQLS
ncbi:hypothetical protein [Paractinoplanes durhamensis]|uniref:Uncharacterized protein n=1 Tax=Paractinoplanes durhamensis TaxID=113563 RepID=A0ABQ3Z0K7_9ACTN|nr:hypothetical protein [Actinoplanes durhamensis]GIE03358.1 hypothetical protein Adu01nite_47080 [Actinoplanes durhamensis]